MSASDVDRAAHDADKKIKQTADTAEKKYEQGKQEAEKKYEQGKQEAKELKNDFIQRLKEDGVKNPKGLWTVGFGPVFIAAVPLVSFISQPNGVLTTAVNGLIGGVGLFATAGKTSIVPQSGKVAALSSLFLIATYAFGGAFSAAAIDSGNEDGRDNSYPRKQTDSLTGLPLRLYSTAAHTIENFGAFGLAAALTQAIAPGDQQLINLLGLHVFTKLFVYGPTYIFNVGPARTISHIIATSAVTAVALKLIHKPLV
ncbi:hypothetical protein MRB53_037248 [Persea americana]|nr:hypothetical protein MRB53_037248 [Persea americana]